MDFGLYLFNGVDGFSDAQVKNGFFKKVFMVVQLGSVIGNRDFVEGVFNEIWEDGGRATF